MFRFTNKICNKIISAKNFVADNFQIGLFGVVDRNKNSPVVRKELAQELQAGINCIKPIGVGEIVIIIFKGGAGIIGRVDVNALDAGAVKRQKCFKCVEVIAVNNRIFGIIAATKGGFKI